jgi:integrase
VFPLPWTGFSKSKAALDEKSGVTGWRLHDLRRTFASGLASQGVAMPVVEKLLNHVSGSFRGVAGIYQRYDFQPEMREAMEKWEAHVTATATKVSNAA